MIPFLTNPNNTGMYSSRACSRSANAAAAAPVRKIIIIEQTDAGNWSFYET